MFKNIKLGFIKLENSVIGSSDHTLTDGQILLIQDIKNLSSKQSLVGSLFFIQIIFVPVNKCKYICIYGEKIQFDNVHKTRWRNGAVVLGREAK